MITEIIAAGSMGISVFFVVKAHSLLKEEQAKENPRLSILRQITIFMGFAILMTPIALGIEFLRHQMDLDNQDQVGFAEELGELENKAYFSMDKNGNPDTINVKFEGVTYQLGTPYPERFFKDTHLKIKKGDGQKFLAVKENNSTDITYGYFDAADINSAATMPGAVAPGSVQVVDEVLEKEKLLATGIMYTPYSGVLRDIQQKLKNKKANGKTANKYLSAFVGNPGYSDELQEMAVKLLVQPEQMNDLKPTEYDQLISALSSDDIRGAPWRYYELAQVYLSLSTKQDKEANLAKYKESLQAYVRDYDLKTWLNGNPSKYPLAYDWYQGARKVLGL
ncbi:MAG: hypothetical protein ACI81P_003177 [Neolewinella sp.]|jgi:hypothetical protein